MNNIQRQIVAIASLACALCGAAVNVTMHTPAGFQVLGVSANGEWACGAYVDATLNSRGFRWNLLTDQIDMLDGTTSIGWDVSNDGVVSGDYATVDDPRNMAGYWKDGAWQPLELPDGVVSDAIGGCITPDGRYMVASLCLNGRYTPYIWHDGQITRCLATNYDAVASAISPDGQAAAGFDSPNNRVNCYWPPIGDPIYFTDSPDYSRGPWSYCRNFSPDGTKLVYWGGWDYDEEAEQNWLYCVYDIASGQRRKLTAPAKESDMEFYDISNAGLCVGYDRGLGYVHDGQQGMTIGEYLLSRGLDLSDYDDFYHGQDYYQGQLPIFRVVAISGDGNVLSMDYYDAEGQTKSLVVKLDQDFTAPTPLSLSAQQLDGLNTVGLSWIRPVGANNIRGYNIYRDGQKVNGVVPINALRYYDKGLSDGDYQYEVSAVTTAGVETKCQAVTVSVGPKSVERPSALYARQRGVNGVHLSWRPALNGLVHKHYYNADQDLLGNFAVYAEVDVETAVRYDRAEMACYDGWTIEEVSFVPMNGHRGWAVNIYTLDDNGALTRIASQPVTQDLNMRQLNTVRLTTPVAVPNANLIVAIECQVNPIDGKVIGNDMTQARAGYSDLLRITTDPEFYSAYEASLESGAFIGTYSWAIDLGLKSPNGGDDDPVYVYLVMIDGIEEVMTADPVVTLAAGLRDGRHTASVHTIEGQTFDRVSLPVETQFDIAANYPGVKHVTVDGAQPALITWEAPADDDATEVTYSHAETPATSIQGNEADNYSMLIAAKYPAAMLRGYDGYALRSVRYYPMAEASYAISILQNDKEILYFEAPEPVLNQWNEASLPDDIVIDGTSEYMLVIDIYEPTPETGAMGLDDGYAITGYGDLYSIDGGATWDALSDEITLKGNWMMGLVIADNKSVALIVDGYDVYIDNRKKNSERLNNTAYQHDFGKTDGSRHTVRIDTYYPSVDEAVKGEVTYFTLQASGIADVESATEITLRRGANMLVAEGEGVTSLTVIAHNGIEMARALGSQVDISHLRPGVYLVRILVNGETITRKITIK